MKKADEPVTPELKHVVAAFGEQTILLGLAKRFDISEESDSRKIVVEAKHTRTFELNAEDFDDRVRFFSPARTRTLQYGEYPPLVISLALNGCSFLQAVLAHAAWVWPADSREQPFAAPIYANADFWYAQLKSEGYHGERLLALHNARSDGLSVYADFVDRTRTAYPDRYADAVGQLLSRGGDWKPEEAASVRHSLSQFFDDQFRALEAAHRPDTAPGESGVDDEGSLYFEVNAEDASHSAVQAAQLQSVFEASQKRFDEDFAEVVRHSFAVSKTGWCDDAATNDPKRRLLTIAADRTGPGAMPILGAVDAARGLASVLRERVPNSAIVSLEGPQATRKAVFREMQTLIDASTCGDTVLLAVGLPQIDGPDGSAPSRVAPFMSPDGEAGSVTMTRQRLFVTSAPDDAGAPTALLGADELLWPEELMAAVTAIRAKGADVTLLVETTPNTYSLDLARLVPARDEEAAAPANLSTGGLLSWGFSTVRDEGDDVTAKPKLDGSPELGEGAGDLTLIVGRALPREFGRTKRLMLGDSTVTRLVGGLFASGRFQTFRQFERTLSRRVADTRNQYAEVSIATTNPNMAMITANSEISRPGPARCRSSCGY